MSEQLEDIETSISYAISRLVTTGDYTGIKQLSNIHGKAPLFMAFMMAWEKRVSSINRTIRAYNPLEKTYEDHVTDDCEELSFVRDFFEDFLRLRISNDADGRHGVEQMISSALSHWMQPMNMAPIYTQEGLTIPKENDPFRKKKEK